MIYLATLIIDVLTMATNDTGDSVHMNTDRWGEYEGVYRYLVDQTYGATVTKDEKRRVREKAEHYVIKDTTLFHRGKNNKLARVVVDVAEKDTIISRLHTDLVGGCHYGQTATIRKITDRFWWKGVSEHVRDFVRTCVKCQRSNPSNKAPPSVLHPIAVKEIFHRWGIDMVGPLKETPNGNKYLIVATEYLTRWVEAKAVPDKSAKGIHEFLMGLVCRYGSCHVLLHDQGREFNNQLVNNLCESVKIQVAMSSAYHPQTNGLVNFEIIFTVSL